MTTPSLSAHRTWLEAETTRLLNFGRRCTHPEGGALWLDDDGAPVPERGTHTWITARMVHVYSLGALLGVPGAAAIAASALDGLLDPLRDTVNGGWFRALDADRAPVVADGKACYDHAFVMLAASSATVADLPGARALLEDAAAIFEQRFWDEESGMCVDAWDATFTTLDPYRGVNGNMHAVEAMLAVADVLDEPVWRTRAARITAQVVEHARPGSWRIPEHFDSDWTPQPDLNRDRPADRFKPYGATVGHGLEWSRLILHLEASGEPLPFDAVEAARGLYDRAVTDGWASDGTDGFVYTTDWDGTPVVRDRLHWVVCEAVAAAAALAERTADPRYATDYYRWWDYADQHLIDRARGSWHHELGPDQQPSHTVWEGKPDLYHAVQAVLLPRVPLAPSLASAVAAGLVRRGAAR